MKSLVLFVYIFGAYLTNGQPLEKDESKKMESSYMTDSNSLSVANGYRVSISQRDVDGECISTLIIIGNHIYKKVESACPMEKPIVINLSHSLLVGDYFTDAPGELVHITADGLCEKEFFEKDGMTMPATTWMLSSEDCDKVKIKVEVLREEQAKWNEWYKQQQQAAQQQLQQIQQNLMALQQNVFGNFFTGFGGFLGKK